MKKVLYGFGDSLVDGHCVHVGMLDALAEKYGLEYHKYAVNGAAIIPVNEKTKDLPEVAFQVKFHVPDVAKQVEDAPDHIPDYVVFDGLTNDDARSDIQEHIGAITQSFDGTYDCETFYGAFERVCYLLKKKYRGSQIFYVAVHRMPTRDMEVEDMLQSAAREVCGKWSIPVVDVYRTGKINTCKEEMRERYSYDTEESLTGGNGTHLNPDGYETFYLPMLEEARGLDSGAKG